MIRETGASIRVAKVPYIAAEQFIGPIAPAWLFGNPTTVAQIPKPLVGDIERGARLAPRQHDSAQFS
jgi:hypothetical protein